MSPSLLPSRPEDNLILKFEDCRFVVPKFSELLENAEFEVARYRSAGSALKDSSSPQLGLPQSESILSVQIKGAQSYLMDKACQDRICVKENDAFIVAAVSDGISMMATGSNLKSRTEIGAAVLSNAAVEFISAELESKSDLNKQNLLDPKFIAKIYQSLLTAMLKDAEKQAQTSDDFRSKYLGTISIFIRIKGGESIHLSVGDGVLAQDSGQLQLHHDIDLERKMAKIRREPNVDADKLSLIRKDLNRQPDLVAYGLMTEKHLWEPVVPTLRVNIHGPSGSGFATGPVLFGSDGLNHVRWHMVKPGYDNEHSFPLIDFISRPAAELNLLAGLYQFCIMQEDYRRAEKPEKKTNILRSIKELAGEILKDPSRFAREKVVAELFSESFNDKSGLLYKVVVKGLTDLNEAELPAAFALMQKTWKSFLKKEGIQAFIRNINDDVGAVFIPAAK